MRTIGAGVFGRDREFVAVTSVATGHDEPWALVLEGEPGMGKTTLWRLGVAQAERSGQRVLTSSPASGETQLSFAVLSDLLADALHEVGSAMPVPQRRALEQALLLDDGSADASQPGEPAEPAEPRTVLAATQTCLRLLSDRGPLVVAIDDIQWIDPPSAAALAFAVRRLGESQVSILAARRVESGTTERSEFESAVIHRHGEDLKRVEVGPLGADVLHAAILDRLGITFAHRVVEQIHQTSGGNPFYALELARALKRHPEGGEPGSALPVPDTLQQLVRSRLEDLSVPTRDLLDVVTLLSDPTLARLEAAGVRGSVEDAVAAGVIEIADDERVRFAHPLLASGAAARLAPDSRRALHLRLADLVEGEERARHLALGAGGPSSAAAAALEEAAREAASRGAIGAAAELAEQALRLTPVELSDLVRERQLEAAAYEVRRGDIAHARRHLEPLLAELPPGPTRAGVLVQLARMGEQAAARSLELCLQAIAEAGQDNARAAEAHQLAAEMSMLSGDIPSALDHARRACDLAAAAPNKAKLIESLGTLCHYQTYTGTIEPGLLEGAVDLERQQSRPSNNYSPREILGLRLMYSDRLDEARVILLASFETATELGDELDRGALLIHLTQLECRAGRLADADKYAAACLVTHEQSGYGLAGARFVTALADAHLGRVEQARAAARDGAAQASRGGNQVFRVLNDWALGFLELSLGNHEAAAERLRELPATVDAMGYRNPGVRPVHADAIEARVGVGDLGGDVEAMIDDLAERGRAFQNASVVGAAERSRGLLAAQLGDADKALTYFARSLDELSSSPQPLQRGRTLLALGATLRRAKRRREARETLGEALEIFDLLGTPLWAERAAGELARIPGRGASSGQLSETERRVAELVADGLSNKEVAAKLFVSVRTVEANLSSIYTKLGLRSRSELAGRMSQR